MFSLQRPIWRRFLYHLQWGQHLPKTVCGEGVFLDFTIFDDVFDGIQAEMGAADEDIGALEQPIEEPVIAAEEAEAAAEAAPEAAAEEAPATEAPAAETAAEEAGEAPKAWASPGSGLMRNIWREEGE